MNCPTASKRALQPRTSATRTSPSKFLPTGHSSCSAKSATPGLFPCVPGITAETAIAVAGGFTDRANRRVVKASRTVHGQLYEERMPVTERIRPGDTIYDFESPVLGNCAIFPIRLIMCR